MALSRLKATHRLGIGLLAAVLVVSLIFVVPGSVKAVSVTMPDMPSTMAVGNSYTFTAQIDIASNEAIPISSLRIDLIGPNSVFAIFNTNGTITSQSGNFTSIVPLVTPFFGYGYQYANGSGIGWGYGYGYGYGNSGTTQLKYQVTFSTAGLTAGAYSARLTVNTTGPTFQSSYYSVSLTAGGGGGVSYTPPSAPPPPPPPPPPAPTPTPTPAPPLTGTGVVGGLANRDANGRTIASSNFTSGDGRVGLAIPAGTRAVDSAGNLLNSLSVAPQTNPPPPPANNNIVGLPFELGPTGAVFDQAITLTFSFDPTTLPAGTNPSSLTLAYFNTTTGQWVSLPTTFVPPSTLTGTTTHFTTFAILVPRPAPAPQPPVTPPAGGTTGGAGGGTSWLLIGAIIAALIIAAIVLYVVIGRRRSLG